MDLEELKKLQKELITKYKICETIEVLGIIVIVGIFVYYYKTHNNADIINVILQACMYLVILLAILETIKYRRLRKDRDRFNKNYKYVVIYNALKKRFSNLTYKPGEGIKEETLNKTNLFKTGDRYRSNDYITGTYKNIFFEQSDVHIEERHERKDLDGNKIVEYITIFKGRLLIFDFNKHFKAKLQISSKNFQADKEIHKKEFSQVKMEDEEYNKQFITLAENEHEAFYILTPTFILKIKNIYRELKCDIMFCFYNNKLFVAINNNKDSFEYNVFKKIKDEKFINNLTKDIEILTKLAEELNLDNNLFLSDK